MGESGGGILHMVNVVDMRIQENVKLSICELKLNREVDKTATHMRFNQRMVKGEEM